ncbi:MAG: PD-(D/E)XK nuclease family protein, partial [Helicobacter sp.]|nr:PD-(D/E)XK nuclease family protein [Helicobacter sp.]MDY5741131.1 PD-(D/E)XK nuclease family protein [Helicobacter sp.]
MQSPTQELSLQALQSRTLLVYSSKRSLRSSFIEGSICPPSMLLGEFFSKAIIYKDKTIIPKHIRKFILGFVLKNHDFTQLCEHGLVFEKSFLAYLESSEFFLQFFDELFVHNIAIQDIPHKDIYGEYEDHLHILEAVLRRYEEILNQHNWVYKSRDFELSYAFLERFSHIKLFLQGILNPYELEILKAVSSVCQVSVCFESDEIDKKIFALPLEKNMYYELTYPDAQILTAKPLTHSSILKALSCSSRISQVGAINAKITQWLEQGIKPEQITLILPSRDFMLYLQALDLEHNFNYAFGKPLAQSIFFQTLKAKLESLQESTHTTFLEKIAILQEAIIQCFLATPTQALFESNKQKMLELLSQYEYIQEFLSTLSLQELTKYLLQEIQTWNLYDVSGGRISVIEILESRGLSLEYILLPDCNECFIPNLKQSDLFLNTTLRQRLNMPTLKDKKSLQLSYYTSLLRHAKEALVLFVEDEDNAPSHLIDMLEIQVQPSSFGIFTHTNENIREYKSEEYHGTLPQRFSPTSFQVFIDCKRKFYFRYLCNLKLDETASTSSGLILHKILELSYRSFIKRLIYDIAEIEHSALKLLQEQTPQNAHEEMELCHMELHLKRFFENERRFIEHYGGFELLGLEVPLQGDIAGFRFEGRADRIQRLQSGEVLILDYKYKNNLAIQKDDFSLEIYRQMYLHQHPQESVSCAFYDMKNKSLDMLLREQDKQEL